MALLRATCLVLSAAWLGGCAPGAGEPSGPASIDPPTTTGVGGSGGSAPVGGGASAAGGGAGATAGAGGAGGAGGAAVPLDGFGAIAGDCGVLSPFELTSSSSYLFENAIDFGALEFDYAALSPGGQEVYDDGNLGGSSLYSEVFSFEVLYRCELAHLLKTEGEIAYQDEQGTKTDLLVAIDALRTGVSVTRAFKYPPSEPYTVTDAALLLEDKLADVIDSSANVEACDDWDKQILHVLAYGDEHAAAIAQAYGQLDPAVRADTIVLVTVTDGNDEFLY